MTTNSAFLDSLALLAKRAAALEDEVRREAAARIKELERKRAFAHRRLNLMRAVVEAVATTEDEAIAVAAAAAILRNKLGWSSDSEARTDVLSRFAPVARQLFAGLTYKPEDGGEPPDADAALAAFESWYRETHPQPFWVLFENQMPETPLIDF